MTVANQPDDFFIMSDDLFVGLTLKQADDVVKYFNPNASVRMARREGCPCVLTRDWQLSRWNFAIRGNIIEEVLGRG